MRFMNSGENFRLAASVAVSASAQEQKNDTTKKDLPLKTERTANKTYRTRDDAKADVFDYIERFYN